MKITVSELKRIIKEEVSLMELKGIFKSKKGSVEVGADFDAAAEEKKKKAITQLVGLIDAKKMALGFKAQDEEAFTDMIGDLLQALAEKYKVPEGRLAKFATHTAKDMKTAVSDKSGSKPGTQTSSTK